jgi:hypothetical protein
MDVVCNACMRHQMAFTIYGFYFRQFKGMVWVSGAVHTPYTGPGEHSQYSGSLLVGRFRVRTPVETFVFSVPFQTASGAHPSSSNKRYRVSLPGAMRPGRGVDHPLPSSAEIKCECSCISALPTCLRLLATGATFTVIVSQFVLRGW